MIHFGSHPTRCKGRIAVVHPRDTNHRRRCSVRRGTIPWACGYYIPCRRNAAEAALRAGCNMSMISPSVTTEKKIELMYVLQQ